MPATSGKKQALFAVLHHWLRQTTANPLKQTKSRGDPSSAQPKIGGTD
jgi:hypothetical protein